METTACNNCGKCGKGCNSLGKEEAQTSDDQTKLPQKDDIRTENKELSADVNET